MPARARTAFALIVAGVLVLQLGWTFVVPAFGGIDEFDHAYRAASLAQGHWATSSEETVFGRGTLIRVPSDIVEAAHDRCEILPYPGLFNCRQMGDPDRRGDVLVASGASRYNPAYHWVVGTIAQPFEGAAALYAMRIGSALLCTLLLAAALWVALVCGRSLWPVAGLLLGLTPVVLYSTTVVAPNGLQMAAAVLMWSASLALMLAPSGKEATLLTLLAVAVPVVLITHTSGPMWVGLTALTVVSAWPRRVADVWRGHAARVVSVAAWCLAVLAASAIWTLTQKANIDGDASGNFEGLTAQDLLVAMALWTFQAVGALPFRNEYMPVAVFAVSMVPFLGLVAAGFIAARARVRAAMGMIVVLSFAVPVVLTLITFSTLGLAWQGRYALPFSIGLLLIACWTLDRKNLEIDRTKVFIPVSIGAFALSQVISLATVAHRQEPGWPTDHSAGAPPIVLVVALGLVATALIVGGTLVRQDRSTHELEVRTEGAGTES